MDKEWPDPSPRLGELIRRGAEIALNPRAAWIEELHSAALSGERMRPIAEDPVLREETKRMSVVNVLHWAAANVQRPGQRVPANVGPEALDSARDLVRRGLDAGALDSYRTAQNVAWRRWMDICFDLTSDPAELRALLDLSSRSISTFLDDTLAAITERMQIERDDLTLGTHAERRAAVTLILQGAPISRARAEAQLGYRLGGPHTAAVLWSGAGTALDDVEETAELVMKSVNASHRLTVVASVASLWIWLPVAEIRGTGRSADQLADTLAEHPGVRVALGRPGQGADGFRRSHLEALTTQRMLTRLTSPRQVARFGDVQLVALMTQDPTQADDFVRNTLGALADADAETRETVRTYVREQCNASRTAERLYTHRNTVLRRLARADELLPRPLAEDLVGVAAALDVLYWRG
jgi:DNA-binding PucR family transcriptional regulator